MTSEKHNLNFSENQLLTFDKLCVKVYHGEGSMSSAIFESLLIVKIWEEGVRNEQKRLRAEWIRKQKSALAELKLEQDIERIELVHRQKSELIALEFKHKRERINFLRGEVLETKRLLSIVR